MTKSAFAVIFTVISIIIIVVFCAVLDWIIQTGDEIQYPKPSEYSEKISHLASYYALDEHVIYAIIKIESNFDTHAVSVDGALGLMQILPSTFEKDIREKLNLPPSADLFDADTNLEAGVYYFSKWYKYYGDIDTALAAYNAGPGRVNTWLKDKRYSFDGKTLIAKNLPDTHETYKYIKRFHEVLERYNKEYAK